MFGVVKCLPWELAADLVTETDRAVEKFVIGALKERYPDYE
jgi:fructose-1,6-bisphosphatase/inositol monophosphatase family enzyme